MIPKNLQETIKKGDRGAAVRELQTALNTIGAALVVDGEFGEVTDDTVRDFQAWRNLVEDGIVGPKTWTEIEQALARHAHMAKHAKDTRLEDIGKKVVERALALWALDIYDPKKADTSADAKRCKEIIALFIQEGLGWRWIKEYKGDGTFEWCLAFASYCWEELKEALRVVYGASTYRWDRFGSYESAFGEPNPAPADGSHARMYMQCDEDTTVDELEWEPRAGDIALVGKTGYGTHGVLVESFDKAKGCIHTIEGNANGRGPNGERQQGIVRNTRYFGHYAGKNQEHVRRVTRPGIDDIRP